MTNKNPSLENTKQNPIKNLIIETCITQKTTNTQTYVFQNFKSPKMI